MKALREHYALSKADLAKLTGFSASAISFYEQGKRRPSPRFIRKLDQIEASLKQHGSPDTIPAVDWRHLTTIDPRLTAIESRLGRLEAFMGQLLEVLPKLDALIELVSKISRGRGKTNQ